MSRFAVKYREGASAEAIAALEARLGVSCVHTIGALGIRIYEIGPELVAAFAQDDLVEYVEEDQQMGLS